jgi:Zn-dependent protease
MDDPSSQLAHPEAARKKPRRGVGAALGAAGVLLLKFGSLLKLALPFAKTGATMVIMIWLYSMRWGWVFAAGFVVLILVHECGHLLAARHFGLPVSAPIFIPFMGAFIALKGAPKDAWMEACVGIGGPALGTAGALACGALYYPTQNPLFLALCYSACFLNLFNLIPISPLDGGRIAAAISPWLWAVGVVILGAALYLGWLQFNFVILMILILCAFRVARMFGRKPQEDASYFAVSLPRRCAMAAMYVGLAAVLTAAMAFTRVQVRRPPPAQYSRTPSQLLRRL